MQPRIAIPFTAALTVFLIFGVYLQVWGVPSEVRAIARIFPEVEPIVVPSIIWGAVAIACWQAVAVLGLRVTAFARHDEFVSSVLPALRAMAVCLVVFFVLVALAFIALIIMGYSTPGVMLGLLAAGLITLCAASALGLFLAVRR